MGRTRQMDTTCNTEQGEAVVGHYDRNAQRLAENYESLTFEKVHQDLLPHLPELPARVLDIGAGSGRDAGTLAGRGYEVLAVEPSTELRSLGSSLHFSPNLTWRAGRLPKLETIEQGERFDLILCSAVWMHLRRAEQRCAMRRIAELCAEDGRVCITFRTGITGEDRLVFEVSAKEVMRDAAANNLQFLKSTATPDWCARTGVNWISLIFQKK